jgi:hypothetical protein
MRWIDTLNDENPSWVQDRSLCVSIMPSHCYCESNLKAENCDEAVLSSSPEEKVQSSPNSAYNSSSQFLPEHYYFCRSPRTHLASPAVALQDSRTSYARRTPRVA